MNDTDQSLSEEKLLDLLEQMQAELANQKNMTEQIASYNVRLESENQKLTEKIEKLNNYEELLRKSENDKKKLLADNEKLKKKNELLLRSNQDLSQSTKDANKQLHDFTTKLHDFEQLNKNIATAQKQIETFTTESIKQLEAASKNAQKLINETAYTAKNTGSQFTYSLLICIVVTVVNAAVCYNITKENTEILDSVKSNYTMIHHALYNQRGFAVLNGTIYNEAIMPKSDPIIYKYLKDIEAGKIEPTPPDKKWYEFWK